ncbi:probable chitinase 10 [Spodoptera litura]|uniref:Probable chitinase 10 n=1 Tax=Spodoptera litura TaxID=69820 RepID=A0A9J7DV36_SPOLT|nr:probable chitinase 10 [Spodoptera litura]
MYKIISLLTLIAASSAQYLPNGCPSDFKVHILLPHESDCSKYYICSNGKKIEMSCEPGTLFDINMQLCNWADEIDCPHPPSSSSSTTPQKLKHVLPNGCPSDFTIHYLLPHETDCDKFYSCSRGRKILMPCTSGMCFDYTIQRCGNPFLVNCTSGSTTSVLAPIPIADDLPSVELLPNGCPVNFSYNYRIPHESDCKLHYHCQFGEKIEMQCDYGLLYDYRHMACVYPEFAKCYSGEVTTSSNLALVPPADEHTTGCPADVAADLLLDHESDCAKFYICNHGNKVEMDCPNGLWFDFVLQYCSWPFMVNCKAIRTTTTTTTTTTTPAPTTVTDRPTTTEGMTKTTQVFDSIV